MASNSEKVMGNFTRPSMEFIIGTQTRHLQFKCPDNALYPLSIYSACHNKKITELANAYNCVKCEHGEIYSSHGETAGLRKCIDEGLGLGYE